MKIQRLNLKDKEIRDTYSEKLKDFENEFSYPLGQSSFKISHGRDDDYFSFFDQMGKTNYFVAEENNKVVAAGCAVLRTSEDNKKYWYLCDFKITKEYRGKNILEKMLTKYFIPCVVQSHRVVAVNMSNKRIDRNGLVNKIQKMFWFFDIDVQWLNLHQWTKKELKEENIDVGSIYTNIGRKDIVIENEPWQLYHIANPTGKLNQFKKIGIAAIPEQSTIMCSVLANNDNFSKKSLSGTGVVISSGMKNIKVSSLEI